MTEQRHASLGLHPIAAEPGETPIDLLKRQQVVRRAQITGLVVLLLLALGGARTLLARSANAQALQAVVEENARQYVKTTQARRSDAGQSLALAGTLQGLVQAPISARASGYLRHWSKDIGASVVKGELLAEIDSPEIDQQLSQALAARDQAVSGLALARSTVERWEGLRKKDVVSQQDLDERRSAVAQSQSFLAAAEANVQRLRQLEAFKRVLAPFSGVITRRFVDVGDLIDSSRPLFTLAQSDKLRVYINVPQAYAHLVKAGQPVVVTQGEWRDQRFTGQVVRTAASIDAATRTMQVEVALPNDDGRLLPGAYVQVDLPLRASAALLAPSATLLFRAEGTMVAVVDAAGRVSLKRVAVGRNYGSEFEVQSGIAATDRLVLNPADWLADGQSVTVAAPAPAASAAAPGRAAAAKERS
jgi:RND family efflux transporter MFP subunit